jgi:enoyl-CoA hydratase/carnithine racemase
LQAHRIGKGLQQLARLIGPEAALKIVVTGEPISAGEALKLDAA